MNLEPRLMKALKYYLTKYSMNYTQTTRDITRNINIARGKINKNPITAVTVAKHLKTKTIEEIVNWEFKRGSWVSPGITGKYKLSEKEFSRAKWMVLQGVDMDVITRNFGVSRWYFNTHKEKIWK